MPRALQRLLDGLPPLPSMAMLSREELLRISDQEEKAQQLPPQPPLPPQQAPEWPDVIGAGQGLAPASLPLQELVENPAQVEAALKEELAALVPDLATSPSNRLRDAEGRLARAARAYQKVRPHLTLQEPSMAVPFHILDTVLGWQAVTAPAPEALEKPGVGWDDPEEVVPIEVTRTFINPRFVQVQAKKRRGEHYLWLKATDFHPRVGDKLSALPNPDEAIGGYILFGDYNRRGERLG